MDIKINNRITAKDIREKANNSIENNLKVEAENVYALIKDDYKNGSITLSNRAISKELKSMLEDDGYVVKEKQTGMNEYSTVIEW